MYVFDRSESKSKFLYLKKCPCPVDFMKMTVEISKNLLVIPIVASLWNLVLVFVITVLNENYLSPSCPPILIHTTRDRAIVTVINRSAELSLMDNNITTCLTAFDEGWRFVYMIAYIYVPVSIPFPWWRHQMETFSTLLAICAGNSPVTGEFPTQRPVTRSFDVIFDLCPNKRLSKQWWGWWFETPSHTLWRQSNDSCDHGHPAPANWPFIIQFQRQGELYYQECGLVEKRDIDGLVQQCEFLCYDLCPVASMVNVGVRAEKLPLDSGVSGKMGGVTVTEPVTIGV